MGLNIVKERVEPDIVVVRLIGRLTLGKDSEDCESQLNEMISQKQKRIVLDLTELNYMDSTGLGIVATSSGRLRQAGGELRLAGVKGPVLKLFKITGVMKIFKIYETLEKAVQSFSAGAAGA